MTYHPKYSLRSVKGSQDENDLTLYEARKKLQAAASSGNLQDATRITRRSMSTDRFVAFFCEWRNAVRPGFQANQQERNMILPQP